MKEVRKETQCRGIKGFSAHLLHVERGLETNRNLKKKAGKPKTIVGRKMGQDADMDFRVVGGGGKGHKACRRVGGDWGKCALMTTYKGQRECHLFMSLASLKPKSG